MDQQNLLTGAAALREVVDRWCWLPDSTRGFTVKSCYEWLCLNHADLAGQVESTKVVACKKLWKNDVPSKALIFSSKLFLGRIATREALHRRGILTFARDLNYVFCFKEIETISQLFGTCEVTKEIWSRIFAWLGVDANLSSDLVSNVIQFGEFFKGKQRRGIRHLIWIATDYRLLETKFYSGEKLQTLNLLETP